MSGISVDRINRREMLKRAIRENVDRQKAAQTGAELFTKLAADARSEGEIMAAVAALAAVCVKYHLAQDRDIAMAFADMVSEMCVLAASK